MSDLLKGQVFFIFTSKNIFGGIMPLKCSKNNAKCFCLTKMFEKMLASLSTSHCPTPNMRQNCQSFAPNGCRCQGNSAP